MAQTNILQLAFRTEDDKKRVMSISPVKGNVTTVNAQAVGAALIASEALTWAPAELIGATFIQRVTATLV